VSARSTGYLHPMLTRLAAWIRRLTGQPEPAKGVSTHYFSWAQREISGDARHRGV
jgi:hypothetical protein